MDIRTLIVSTAIISLASALLIFLIHKLRFSIQGTLLWVYGSLTISFSLILIALRGILPEFITIVMANTVVIYGFGITLSGMRVFIGRSNILKFTFMPPLVIAPFMYWYSAVHPSLASRIVLCSIAIAVLTGAIAGELLRKPKATSGLAQQFTGYIYATNAAFFILRIPLTLIDPPAGSFFNSGMVTVGILVWEQIYFVGIAAGMTLMIGEKLQDRQKRAEDTLIESERKMASTFRAAPIGIGVVSNRVIQEVNERFCDICGYSKDELIGQSSRIVYPTDDEYETVGRKKYRQIEESGIGSIETRFKRKDGRPIDVLVRSSPLDPEDLSAGVTFTALDITERKEAEKQLQQAEARSKAILDTQAEHVILQDTSHGILWPNQAACESAGLSRDELIGRRCYEIWAQRTSPCIDCPVAKAIDTGRPQEVEKTTPDNACWIIRGRPLRNAEDEIVGAVEVTLDITERKRFEEALLQSESKFKSLFDLSPQAIALTETETGKIVDVNDKYCRLSQYAKEELIGKTAMETGCYTEEERRKIVTKLKASGQANGIEMQCKAKDGSMLDILVSAKIIHLSGKPVILSVGYDVTRLKQLEEKLRNAQKMEALGTLSGGVAHEFNNILGIILGNTELALDENPEQSGTRDFLKEIQMASLRAKEVVQKILSFARKAPAALKPIDISDSVRESVKLIRSTLPTHIDICRKIHCGSEMILANPTEIHQILMNLCSNAAHSIEETGSLTIRLEPVLLDSDSAGAYEELKPGEYVRLCVRDNGKGIEPEILPMIFDPYFTTKDVDKGLGMGLAIVYGIVKKHEGAIKVRSKVGKGTTIEVLFPVTNKIPEIAAEEPENLPTGTERILFVDDEASLVKLGRQMLERQGYKVVGETSPAEALKLFQEKPGDFDMVITDMAMPNMPGDRLAKELIKIRPSLPVIVCTGHSDRIDDKKAAEFGIKGYYMKPFVKKDLVKTARKILDAAKNNCS